MESDCVMEITEEEFQEIVDNGHKLVIVDFFAEWCMPCIMMSPVVDEIAEKMKNVKFVKINIDDNECLSKKHSISSIPCMIIFKNGKEVDRITGSFDSEDVEEKIKEHL